jgi:hypothetical protein
MPRAVLLGEHSAIPSTGVSRLHQTGWQSRYDEIDGCHRHELAQTVVLGIGVTSGEVCLEESSGRQQKSGNIEFDQPGGGRWLRHWNMSCFQHAFAPGGGARFHLGEALSCFGFRSRIGFARVSC